MTDWPKLPELRTYLRLQVDATEDTVIDAARAAAVDYGNRRTNYQWDPAVTPWATPMPDSVHQACLMHASRLYKRRDTVDGTIAWGDLGAVRVGRTDPDVEALYSGVGPLVFG